MQNNEQMLVILHNFDPTFSILADCTKRDDFSFAYPCFPEFRNVVGQTLIRQGATGRRAGGDGARREAARRGRGGRLLRDSYFLSVLDSD